MARSPWLSTRRSAQRGTSKNRRRQRGAASSRRPWFEPLEERRLLAITVNTLVDELDGSIVDGNVSLRDAIAAAPVGETINFAPALNGQTITLSLGELVLDKSVKIDASALADGITIDASGNDPTPAVDKGDGSRVFRITDELPGEISVELRGLTLTGGDVSGNGGAVLFSRAGSLTITSSTITGNRALAGGGIHAVASNSTTVTIRDSTISGNVAVGDGGGVYLSASSGGGAASIIQSTISGNSANWRGGGVWANSQGTTISILHSTITLNTADADKTLPAIETGGGVFASGNGTLKLENSIVAANVDPHGHAPDLKNFGATLAARYSLIGTNGGSGLAAAPVSMPDANGNIVGGAMAIDPGLAPLADNGGPTLTHALVTTSVAVNRGDPLAVAGLAGTPQFDQRGVPYARVLSPMPRIDIGAVEFNSPPLAGLVVDTLVDEDDGNFAPGDVSLREVIRAAQGINMPTITFDPALSGQSIVLAVGELTVPTSMTIDASALPDGIIIDGGGQFRVFRITADSTLRGLTIRGGKAPGDDLDTYGAGIRVQASNFTLIDCTIEENAGAGVAGGSGVNFNIDKSVIRANDGIGVHVYAPFAMPQGGRLNVTDSVISENSGVGISVIGTPLTMARSIVSGNRGGIAAGRYSNTTISQSTIANNEASGISLDSNVNLTLSESTIRGNKTDDRGGAIRVANRLSSVAISHSTIADNFAAQGGGGISTSGALTITNSTISGNSTNGQGGGIAANASIVSGPVIRHTTITGNFAASGGGGLTATSVSSPLLENCIIAGNTAPDGKEPDLEGYVRLRYSLVGQDHLTAFPVPPTDQGGSMIGTNESPIDPLLGPLADNGGPTFTHALLPGSPALNAGDPSAIAGQGSTPEFDQRGVGFGRMAGGRIDIGAFELGAAPNTPPQITSPASVAIAENSSAVLTVTADDAEAPPQTIAFSIVGGDDAAFFQLLPTGELSFKSAPDYESPADAGGDNAYVVRIQADDGHGGLDEQDVTVTVLPTNDNAPIFLSPSELSVPEGATLVLPVTAMDADLPAQIVSYSIVGGADADKFVIATGGALSFIAPPDFAAPSDADGDNVYLVEVEANDSAGGATIQTISVRVTSSNPPSADFNGDGFVTAADLAIWRQNFGTTAGPTPGDADGDRDVDGNDFLIWQRTLGQVVPPAAATVLIGDDEKMATAKDARQFHLAADVVLALPTDASSAIASAPRRSRPHHRPPAIIQRPSQSILDRALESLSSTRRESAAAPAEPSDGESHRRFDAVFEEHDLAPWRPIEE